MTLHNYTPAEASAYEDYLIREMVATAPKRSRSPQLAQKDDRLTLRAEKMQAMVLAAMSTKWEPAEQIARRVGLTAQAAAGPLMGLRTRGIVESSTTKSGPTMWRRVP